MLSRPTKIRVVLAVLIVMAVGIAAAMTLTCKADSCCAGETAERSETLEAPVEAAQPVHPTRRHIKKSNLKPLLHAVDAPDYKTFKAPNRVTPDSEESTDQPAP